MLIISLLLSTTARADLLADHQNCIFGRPSPAVHCPPVQAPSSPSLQPGMAPPRDPTRPGCSVEPDPPMPPGCDDIERRYKASIPQWTIDGISACARQALANKRGDSAASIEAGQSCTWINPTIEP